MNPSISIPGNFRKTGTGAEWQTEIETAVSDLPRTVTGFIFHARITFASSAAHPSASVFVAKEDKPRTVATPSATIALSGPVTADLSATGTFGADHMSGAPILVSVCSEGTDPSDAIYITDMRLELTE